MIAEDAANMPGSAENAADGTLESPAQTLAPLPTPPQELGIGDPNPGLHVATWVKGEPVDQTLTGKVHVVEFWATWCGPCRVGMPHISSLQQEYGDEVAFVGVTRETQEKVATFLEAPASDGKTWDETIQYRLAIDDRDWTNTAYMRAAGQNGIPCAFVVGRDGVIEWIGHPGSIDEPLKQIVEGQWDRAAAIVAHEKQQRLQEMSAKLSSFARAKDWDGALEMLNQAQQEDENSIQLMSLRLRVLQLAGRTDEMSAVRAEIVEAAWDDANMLNQIAWSAATLPDSPDLELALKAARRASELRNDEDPAVLDTVARCYYELANLDEAIKWQRLAVEHNQGNAEIEATLEKYLAEKSESGSESESKEKDASSPEEAGE
ncbi:TlpA disulfide reductase family protein [Neorhodopirellula pilleata]|nr:TlpA disulfide reductase family protein [Neorhodopirellula pilleata]